MRTAECNGSVEAGPNWAGSSAGPRCQARRGSATRAHGPSPCYTRSITFSTYALSVSRTDPSQTADLSEGLSGGLPRRPPGPSFLGSAEVADATLPRQGGHLRPLSGSPG